MTTSALRTPGRFIFKRNAVAYRVGRLKNSLYKQLTSNQLPLFFRAGDSITVQPVVNGVYEPEIKALIEHYAATGHADFLLDIGANIGLTSCQSGRHFKELHLYEPNPDCYNVLKVNANILLTGHNYHIHEYGLGEEDSVLRFCIPNNNWGGAFVMSEGNAYSAQTQAEKDGHASFDHTNYRVTSVAIRSARDTLGALFGDLARRGLSAGVIKIDVEGYELTVLEAIARTLPPEMKAVVIFENWSLELHFSTVLDALAGRARLMNMVTLKHPLRWLPRWINTLYLLARGHIETVLVPSEEKAHIGGLVMEIDAA
ncbi:FkbM family methyltransferase [Massilia sp. S19_KUP03_FR1]|uniref:FkbM family methyltransferase n=1 Tax=Massilia sp. S19_KUP03_FR1 TaxID=3025503 RepID=UPI002FCDBA72